MHVQIYFILKNLVAIIYAIKLSKGIIFEYLVVHYFKIGIKCQLSLIVFEFIDFWIDFDQIIVWVVLKSVFLIKKIKQNNWVIAV